MSMTREQRWVAPAAFAVVVIAIAVTAFLNASRSTHAQTDFPDTLESLNEPQIGNGWGPPSNVEAVSLSAARSELSFDLPTPHDELASDSSIQAVYVDGGTGGVRIDYASGLITIVTPWPEGKNPTASYERQWIESGGLGTLQTIGGHSAWVIPGDAKTTLELPKGETAGVSDTSMNVVELTLGNLDVVIVGPQPVSDLIRVSLTEK